MGYGTILTQVLLLIGFRVESIVPTVLLSELLSGFAAAFFHHEVRNVDLSLRGRDFGPAMILVVGSVLGVSGGVFLSLNIPNDALTIVVGCIIMLSGLFVVLLATKAIRYSRPRMILLAAVASFNKAVSGGGYGPLMTSGQILSGVQGKAAVGITAFAEAFTCLIAASLFLLRGGGIDFRLFVPMCAGALLSVPFSVFAISKANEGILRRVIGLLTLALGALTIYKAVS